MSASRGLVRRALFWVAPAAIVIAAFGVASGSRYKEYLRAIWFLNAERPAVSGPFAVGRREVALAIEPWGRTTVTVWYPTDAARPGLLQRGLDRLRHPTSAAAIADAAWPASPARFPLILHFPSWFGTRAESSFTPAELASHGYVVAAVDDFVHLERLAGEDGAAQASSFDFASAEAFEASRDLGRRRALLEARFGGAVIDALLAEPWAGPHLDAGRIGVSGFSFGGAAALELNRIDPRVRAVVNLDGLVLGGVETEGVRGPYLFLSSDTVPPTEEELRQLDFPRRLDRMVDGEVLAFQRRQAECQDNATVFIASATHNDFTDRLLMPAFNETLQQRDIDRVGTWREISQRQLSFFQAHLKP